MDNESFDERVAKLKAMTPAEQAEYKANVIEAYISTRPDDVQTKLRQLQWRINGELRKFEDPIAKMNRMCELFWIGVGRLQKALNDSEVNS